MGEQQYDFEVEMYWYYLLISELFVLIKFTITECNQRKE